MTDLTIFFLFLFAAYGVWRFQRNAKKVADAANCASPETKAKAKEIGAKLLGKWLGS